MHIQIIGVGKLKEKYLVQGIAEYTKRIRPYTKLTVQEVADERAPEQLSDREAEQVKAKEGARILSLIKPDAYVIALAIEGQMLTSEQLAQRVGRAGNVWS